MTEKCIIYRTCQKIAAASHCNVGIIGGSLTAAAGAGDTTKTSWRRLFIEYIYNRFHKVYHCQPSEIMGAVGAMESYGAVFMLERNILPFAPDICFVEFCVNDRGQPNKDLVKKGVEGVIRQLKNCKSKPDIVFLGAGCRPGSDSVTGDRVDHSLHKEIADYYGLGFIDVQDYMYKTLAQRGQDWDAVSIPFVDGDSVHLGDYGNHLWFEAMREWFEEQFRRFQQNPSMAGTQTDEIMPVRYSDELAFTRMIDPAKKNKAIELQGEWVKKENAVPWYFDSLFVGRPGSKLTFTFTGTAVGLLALVYSNGLKIEAKIDGEEVPGAFTRFQIEFGKFFMLGHGLENKPHVLELEVGEASNRHNKHDDPTAEIGYITIAGPDV